MISYRSFETFRLVLTEFSGSNNDHIQKLHANGLLSFGDSVITRSKNCKQYDCLEENLHCYRTGRGNMCCSHIDWG